MSGKVWRPAMRDEMLRIQRAVGENGVMFGRKKQEPQKVTGGRLEIERDGHVAYLEYTLAGKVLQLIHSEVPEALRGQGIASELAHSALEWAREQGLKVDIICPSVNAYVAKHPEYKDLVMGGGS